MDFRIIISIINYRTYDLTIASIRSVLDDLDDIDGHIVVTDNCSGDGSGEKIGEWIAKQDPPVPVTLTMSPTNTGFSGGHNIGFGVFEAAYYLPFNSDAVLRKGFLKTLLKTADAHPESGFFAPKIIYDDDGVQVSCFRAHSPLSELIRTARTSFVTRMFKSHEVALGEDPDRSQIEWASFACILLRGDMVRNIGQMDEGYFLYFEDVEYCMRGREAGWKITYEPDAKVVHFRGGSGPVKSLASNQKRLPSYYYASRTRFLFQAHGHIGLLSANLLWYVGRGVALLTRVAGKDVGPMAAHEAHDIWINFWRPLGPRLAPGEAHDGS